VDTKITESMAQAMADAHADGVSFRALGRLYDISPSLAHRHVHRVNGTTADAPAVVEPERAPPGPESEEPAESDSDVGAAEPAAQARRRPDETEFPAYVAGFLPEGVDATTAIPVVLSPESQRAEERRERAERRAREDAQREQERQAALIAREQELVAACKEAKLGTEEWTRARRELKRFRAGRTRYIPLPSATGVQVTAQMLREGPPRALWDNPYRMPCGTYIVGS
jgi:hypothetical protein